MQTSTTPEKEKCALTLAFSLFLSICLSLSLSLSLSFSLCLSTFLLTSFTDVLFSMAGGAYSTAWCISGESSISLPLSGRKRCVCVCVCVFVGYKCINMHVRNIMSMCAFSYKI